MRSHFAKPQLGEQGFTLLELMISMLLILLVVVITTGALRLGYRSVESGEKRIDAQERFRTSLNLIESQIQSGIPISTAAEGGVKYHFRGEPDALQFSSNHSIWDGRRGYLIADYRVEPDANGMKKLVASENTIGMPDKRETLLMNAMDDIHFEYFTTSITEEGSWSSRWTEDTSIPIKVRVHLVYRGKDFSTVIPIRIKPAFAQTGLTPGALSPGTGGTVAR
jgi:prepilin-type N-terminal cleavage/methylation domain-containing protein